MNGQYLFEVMNDIDDSFVEEAQSYKPNKKRGVSRVTFAIAAAAACIALIFIFVPGGEAPPPDITTNPPELPMLTIDTDTMFEAMGFEGYMAYSIDDLQNANPWNEELVLKALPVYENAYGYNWRGVAESPDYDAMERRAVEVALLLGIDEEDIKISNDAPSQETIDRLTEKYASVGEEVPEHEFTVGKMIASSENIKVDVYTDMSVAIWFEPAAGLPDEINFDYYASYEDIWAAGEYFKDEYKNLLQMDSPQIDVHGGDYNIYANRSYGLGIFEGSGSPEEQIINYNFNEYTFSSDEEGRLWIIRTHQRDLSQKLGDYPIITVEDARGLLIDNRYITTVPEEFPGGDYIRKVELVYRTGRESIYMPYYRFYVELPAMKMDNGLKTYGAYYVPAVAGEYIEEMPLWDGSFN